MSVNDIAINRDRENDVVYILKNNIDPDDTINFEAKPGVIVRLDKKRKAIVGFVIEDFSENMDKLNDFSDYQLMEFFETTLEILNEWNLIPAKK